MLAPVQPIRMLAGGGIPPRRRTDFALVVDLGARIGSPSWFRGLATLGVMIGTLAWTAPGFHALSGRPPAYRHVAGGSSTAAPGIVVARPAVRQAPPPERSGPEPTGRLIATDGAPIHLTGEIGDGLYRSERAAGAPPFVVADYIRAIATRMDIGDVITGDRYDLVFEPDRGVANEGRPGRLLYAAVTHGNRTIRLLRWRLDGREQWLDASGAGAPREGFTMPVADARLSSGFGLRFHPILGFSRPHQGVDLAAPYGAPILAASTGVVRFTGWRGGYGNFVQIDHGGGLGTGYGHMSAFVVHAGESVRQGQLIGYVGSTGLATGPHCHFEVYRDGVAVDPAGATFETVSRLGGVALRRFRAAFTRLTALPIGGAARMAQAAPASRE